MKKERESNIELLRIFCILGVIILHYNNPSGGGGLQFVENGTINFWFLNIMESICVCAVDLFLIISGYFMVNRQNKNIWKPIHLLFQVILFSGCTYLGIHIMKGDFTFKGFINSLVPANYFVILYIVVFILSPYINLIFNNLCIENLKRFMLIVFVTFSVYPTLVDFIIEITKNKYNGLSSIGMYGSQYGYSSINFLLCYCIGAYIRKTEFNKKYKQSTLLMWWMLLVIMITLWSFLDNMLGYDVEKCSLEYCNPIVILSAVCVFLIFFKVDIGYIPWINKLSKGTFIVYLLHGHLITHIGVKNFVNKNIVILMIHMFISISIIYCICWLGYFLYSKVEIFTINLIEKRNKM